MVDGDGESITGEEEKIDADGDRIPLENSLMVMVMVNLLMVRKRWLMLIVTEYHSGVWKQLGQNPSPAFLKVIDQPSKSSPSSLSSLGGFLGLLHHILTFLTSFI